MPTTVLIRFRSLFDDNDICFFFFLPYPPFSLQPANKVTIYNFGERDMFPAVLATVFALIYDNLMWRWALFAQWNEILRTAFWFCRQQKTASAARGGATLCKFDLFLISACLAPLRVSLLAARTHCVCACRGQCVALVGQIEVGKRTSGCYRSWISNELIALLGVGVKL